MAASAKKYRYNATPRLSANQLAEYLTAHADRRTGIIQAAKYPKTSVVARYDPACDAITNFLCSNARSGTDLAKAIEQQKAREQKIGASTWIKQDAQLSAEAINAFWKSYNKLGLGKFSCRPVAASAPKLNINGVDISVALDVTTHRKDKDDQAYVGGIIMVFSKAEASASARERRCRVAAVLSALFAEKHLATLGKTDPKMCISLDVFAGKTYPTPGSYVKRLSQINTSCKEVTLWWPTIDPPDDYDG